MAENPYQPPETTIPAEPRPTARPPSPAPLLPLWRRVVSVTLITLGATFTPDLLASPVAFGIWLFDLTGHGEPHVLLSAVFLIEGLLAVAMIWGGFRLRRRKNLPANRIFCDDMIDRSAQFRSDRAKL